MSSWPDQFEPKSPFLVEQNIARSRDASAYQESLIRRTRADQYAISKNADQEMRGQVDINQAWRTVSLRFASIVATINELLR